MVGALKKKLEPLKGDLISDFFPLFYILWVKPHYLKKKKKQLSQKSGSVIVIEFTLMIKTGRR